MKLKYIPNALSVLRGLMALSIIFINPRISLAGFLVFAVAGVTDMVDGALARRIEGAKSELGATLDSVSDLIMYIVGIFFIIPEMEIWPWLQIVILVAISCKLLNIIPALVKHREVFFTHTVPSKLFTLAIFFVALLYLVVDISGALTAAWVMAINVSFVFLIVWAFGIIAEEAFVISMLAYPEKNIKGFWELKKINEDYRRRQAGKPAEAETVEMK
jgi:phosphatidylglycerophosphate synthase